MTIQSVKNRPPVKGFVNVPAEALWLAENERSAARAEVDVVVENEEGRAWKIPAFHDGGRLMGFRFAAPAPGRYAWIVSGSFGETAPPSGAFDISPYTGDNPLYRHGRLHIAADRRHLEHADGTPFFWLADTWWTGLSTRCDWPRGFRTLAADRLAKGFNTIQIVAGPHPDYCATTDAFNPQQGNEGGLSWFKKTDTCEFDCINPAYYRHADDKIFALVEWGLMPCVFAMWGYYLPFMGVENVKRHWRNLVARYAALPVVWSLCGELDLPTYAWLDDKTRMDERRKTLREGWTEVARYLRAIEPYGTLTTAHPWCGVDTRESLLDPSTYDFTMLQTGHGNQEVLPSTLEQTRRFARRTPPLPTLNAEPCYEGIMGVAGAPVARAAFWISMLEGACGHTYGAQGIWGMNTRDNPFRGTTLNWGDGFWQDVMHYAGSADVGRAKRFLERWQWQRLIPRDEPSVVAMNRPSSLAAEIPGELRVYYIPHSNLPAEMKGISAGGAALAPLTLEPDTFRRAFFWNPRDNSETPPVSILPDSSNLWTPPPRPSMEDWILIVES